MSRQVLARSPVARVCGRTAKVTDRSWLIVVVRCAIMASQLRALGGGWNGQICSVNVLVATSGLRRNRNEDNLNGIRFFLERYHTQRHLHYHKKNTRPRRNTDLHSSCYHLVCGSKNTNNYIPESLVSLIAYNIGWFMYHGLQLDEFYPPLMVATKFYF